MKTIRCWRCHRRKPRKALTSYHHSARWWDRRCKDETGCENAFMRRWRQDVRQINGSYQWHGLVVLAGI